MGKCTICSLDRDVLTAVNKKLRDGVTDTAIAKEYNLSRDSVSRHKRKGHHDPVDVPMMPVLPAKTDLQRSDLSMAEAISAILGKLDYFETMFTGFLERGAYKSAVDVHKEIRQTLQLLLTLKGWLKTDSAVVNIQINTQLDSIADRLIAVVEGCPRCMARLQATLEGMRDVTE